MRFWRNVAHVVDESDVILEIVDARMPFLARNDKLAEMIKKSGKEHLIVFNKSDLVSDSFKKNIENDFKGFKGGVFFVSAKRGNGMPKLRVYLKILAKKFGFERLRVGFVGYPNVGKSALINALARRAKTKVGTKAGTTRGVHWVSYSSLKILDSPGVIPNDEWDEVKLGILGAKNPDKIKDIEKVALAIVDLFIKGNLQALCKVYRLDFIKIKEMADWEIIEAIAESKNLLLKGGISDEKRASYMIVKDWQSGKLNLTG